jgi:hypothetical protein
MHNEPSVLLIDDEQAHDAYFRMMDLDEEGWSIESAIDPTIDGAFSKASQKIDQYGGFSVILLDILWKYDKHGGIKILHRLFKAYGNSLPARQVLIVTRKTDPAVKDLVDKLNIPVDMRTLTLDTQNGRDRLKKCLLRLWRRIRPKS